MKVVVLDKRHLLLKHNMKRIKHRKQTPLLLSQIEDQTLRIEEAGRNAYSAFINPPTDVGSLRLRWVDQIKRQMI